MGLVVLYRYVELHMYVYIYICIRMYIKTAIDIHLTYVTQMYLLSVTLGFFGNCSRSEDAEVVMVVVCNLFPYCFTHL